MSLGYVHKNFWKDLTLVQIEEQIAIRQTMLPQMLGWLYTSILNDELDALCTLKFNLKNRKPEVWPWP